HTGPAVREPAAQVVLGALRVACHGHDSSVRGAHRLTSMTQLRETVRWGIIGVGDVVEHKSGPAFATLPGSELVAVMRRTGGLARDFAVRHGVRSWYDDGDALLADPDVDAVYVATPP